ncbi:MAG: Na+/proline symporter [Thermodesulfobacteriota bacterium]
MSALPWIVLLGYSVFVYLVTPRGITASQFFKGESKTGNPPGMWLLAASAAITWIMAKSISNTASLADAFGIFGGIGYAVYYLSFITAGVTIYFIRRHGHSSISGFLISKYGPLCAKLFLIVIAIRLFNEVWSNTKVTSLYFGAEGSSGYWIAAFSFTAFTVFYSLKGGLRASLITDGIQMLMFAVLLVLILVTIGPGLVERGMPVISNETRLAGLTFCGLAFVQIFSYPFHDPVLTDRAFITPPKTMLKGFILATIISAICIFLFGFVGLYAKSFGIEGNPSVAVPAVISLPMLLVFNAIMLSSAGSSLDSTFASTAKLSARDWRYDPGEPKEHQVRSGRFSMLLIAIIGNLPLLSLYLGEKIGPAIIAATTISGTMVMGLAPIFILSFIKRAGSASFHLALWPGLLFGVFRVLEGATGMSIFPEWIKIGAGKYALDFGINLYGLAICTFGYLIGAWFRGKKI